MTSVVVVVAAWIMRARIEPRFIAGFIPSNAGFIHSKSDVDRATVGSTLLLFDAVPFWLIPHVAPGPFLAAAAE